MKTILSILASALLLTYLSVQLFTLFGQSSPIVLYISIFFSLLINGLFIHYQSNSATQTTKNRRQRPQRKGNSSRTKRDNKGSRPRSHVKHQEKSNQISTKDDANRLEGEIKWYNRRKNYGFIVEDSGDEIFFHQKEVEESPGQRVQIDKGQRVNFVKAETEKGPQAQRVQIIS